MVLPSRANPMVAASEDRRANTSACAARRTAQRWCELPSAASCAASTLSPCATRRISPALSASRTKRSRKSSARRVSTTPRPMFTDHSTSSRWACSAGMLADGRSSNLIPRTRSHSRRQVTAKRASRGPRARCSPSWSSTSPTISSPRTIWPPRKSCSAAKWCKRSASSGPLSAAACSNASAASKGSPLQAWQSPSACRSSRLAPSSDSNAAAVWYSCAARSKANLVRAWIAASRA